MPHCLSARYGPHRFQFAVLALSATKRFPSSVSQIVGDNLIKSGQEGRGYKWGAAEVDVMGIYTVSVEGAASCSSGNTSSVTPGVIIFFQAASFALG